MSVKNFSFPFMCLRALKIAPLPKRSCGCRTAERKDSSDWGQEFLKSAHSDAPEEAPLLRGAFGNTWVFSVVTGWGTGADI